MIEIDATRDQLKFLLYQVYGHSYESLRTKTYQELQELLNKEQTAKNERFIPLGVWLKKF